MSGPEAAALVVFLIFVFGMGILIGTALPDEDAAFREGWRARGAYEGERAVSRPDAAKEN